MMLGKFPVHSQSEPSPEGFQRGIVLVPPQAQMLYLGSTPPNNEIFLFAIVPSLDPAVAHEPTDLIAMEFLVVSEGMEIPSGYVMRAPIRTDAGIVFLFERSRRTSRIVTLGGE